MSDPVTTIYRAVEFIETHLRGEISVAEMAASTGYSLFHFVRTFNRVVKHTPYDYLIRRRLSEAAHALTFKNRRITDIAQDYGFNNHETFTRAFRRMFMVQPSQWRDQTARNWRLFLPAFSLDYLRYVSGDDFQHPVLCEKGEVQLMGLMTRLPINPIESDGQRAGLLIELRDLVKTLSPQEVFGVTVYPEGNDRESAYYMMGIESPGAEAAARLLASYTLPAGRYVCMSVLQDRRQFALQYLHCTWMPKSRMRPAHQLEVEVFGGEGDGSQAYQVCIPAAVQWGE